MTTKPDKINVYRDSNKEWRWVRKTVTNNKIVGASSEGYKRKEGALANIRRTQKGPCIVYYAVYSTNGQIHAEVLVVL